MYVVVIAKSVQKALQTLYQQAMEKGTKDQFSSAARAIDERLKTDPLGWGEPTYHLQFMGLQVRLGVIPPLAVLFAVDENRHIVYVMRFTLL